MGCWIVWSKKNNEERHDKGWQMKKELIIPQSDIDRLEKARLSLFELLKSTPYPGNLGYGITDIMYKLTHTKYQEVELKQEDL